jgi:penicillin amidase
MLRKPHAVNPAEGFIATANNNLTPASYPYRDAIGWEWADPYRFARIAEVLGSGRRHAMMDMMRLQNDYTSLPARALVPLLAGVRGGDAAVEQAAAHAARVGPRARPRVAGGGDLPGVVPAARGARGRARAPRFGGARGEERAPRRRAWCSGSPPRGATSP